MLRDELFPVLLQHVVDRLDHQILKGDLAIERNLLQGLIALAQGFAFMDSSASRASLTTGACAMPFRGGAELITGKTGLESARAISSAFATAAKSKTAGPSGIMKKAASHAYPIEGPSGNLARSLQSELASGSSKTLRRPRPDRPRQA